MAGESILQRKIIDDLEKLGWIVVKIKLCNLNGFPDLMAMKDGMVFFIEVKDEGEDAEPLQKERHKMLRAQKFYVFVVDTWGKYLEIKKRL